MSKRSFRLDTVLRVRRAQEETARAELSPARTVRSTAPPPGATTPPSATARSLSRAVPWRRRCSSGRRRQPTLPRPPCSMHTHVSPWPRPRPPSPCANGVRRLSASRHSSASSSAGSTRCAWTTPAGRRPRWTTSSPRATSRPTAPNREHDDDDDAGGPAVTSVAPTSDQAYVPPIVQQVSSVQSAVQGLGQTIQTDAEHGDFGDILTAASRVLSRASPPARAASTSASTPRPPPPARRPPAQSAPTPTVPPGSTSGQSVVADARPSSSACPMSGAAPARRASTARAWCSTSTANKACRCPARARSRPLWVRPFPRWPRRSPAIWSSLPAATGRRRRPVTSASTSATAR